MTAPRDKAFPVSWDQFHRDARALAWRLASSGPFDALVAITRGGLVPAAIVARELDVRVIETVSIVSYHDYKSQGGLRVLKTIAPDIARLGEGARTLIVDDLVDTGATAKVVREMLPKAHFATRLRQAARPPAGRHFHHRSVAGHLDLLPLGHGPRLPARHHQRGGVALQFRIRPEVLSGTRCRTRRRDAVGSEPAALELVAGNGVVLQWRNRQLAGAALFAPSRVQLASDLASSSQKARRPGAKIPVIA